MRIRFTLLTTLIFSLQQLHSQTPGTIDATFGIGGISTFDEEGYDEIFDLTHDNLDRLYFMEDQFLQVTRATTDGFPDSSYGNNGKAVINGTALNHTSAFVLRQADNKIITGSDSGSSHQLIVTRFTTDGTPDLTFGQNGALKNPADLINEDHSWVDGVLAPDGSVYALANKIGEILIEKITPSGKRDSSFSDDGIAKKDLNSPPSCIALQDDGKILAGGYSLAGFAIARFKTTGDIDNSFGTAGLVELNLGDEDRWMVDLFPQPDGKIVAAGYSFEPVTYNNTIFIMRLNSDGTLDLSYGIGGYNQFTFYRGYYQNLNNMRATRQSDGKILFSYWRFADDNGGSINSKYRATVTRFDADGTIDSVFNSTGSFEYVFGDEVPGKFVCLTEQSSGKLIVGFTYDNYSSVAAKVYLIRLLNDLSIPTAVHPVDGEELELKIVPNPFSDYTSIRYHLSRNSHAIIELFDLQGRKIKTIVEEKLEAGNHHFDLDVSFLPSGIYFLKLSSASASVILKLIAE